MQEKAANKPFLDYARGIFQFELIGVKDCVENKYSAQALMEIDPKLYSTIMSDVYYVWKTLAWNGVWAVQLARAKLWSVREPLPRINHDDQDIAYRQYLSAWKPGKPNPHLFGIVWTNIVNHYSGN